MSKKRNLGSGEDFMSGITISDGPVTVDPRPDDYTTTELQEMITDPAYDDRPIFDQEDERKPNAKK